jgi:hypothetical protein
MQIPVNQPAPAADSTIDSDIADFISEGHELTEEVTGSGETSAKAKAGTPRTEEEVIAEFEAENGDEPDATSSNSDAPTETSDAEPEAKYTGTINVDAVAKAIEAEDPVAFVKALGDHAEKLLTGKAHKALRLQVKNAEQAQTKATDLAVKLNEKYGDPIAARKAAEAGDGNAFIDMIEKWGGRDWNTIQRWLANSMAGRPQRLEAQKQEAVKATVEDTAKQEAAKAEVRNWVDAGLKKAAPELHSPEVIALVEAEIRENFSKGIDSPVKALPAVRKKLQAQYEQLHKVFGKQASKTAPKSPSTKVSRQDHTTGQYRQTSLEEDIADFMKETNTEKYAAPRSK